MTLVTTSLRLRAMLLAVVWLVGVVARAQEEETAEQETPVKVTFVNEMPDTVSKMRCGSVARVVNAQVAFAHWPLRHASIAHVHSTIYPFPR